MASRTHQIARSFQAGLRPNRVRVGFWRFESKTVWYYETDIPRLAIRRQIEEELAGLEGPMPYGDLYEIVRAILVRSKDPRMTSVDPVALGNAISFPVFV